MDIPFDFTLHAKSRVKGHYRINAPDLESAKALMADSTGDVLWSYQELDEDSGVYADIGGPALHGKESEFDVAIIEEPSPRTDGSTFVTTVMVGDEEVEIRRLSGGGLVGLDASFLAQMGDEDALYSPYTPNTVVGVPDDEE